MGDDPASEESSNSSRQRARATSAQQAPPQQYSQQQQYRQQRNMPNSPPLTRAATDNSVMYAQGARNDEGGVRFDSFAQATNQALDEDLRAGRGASSAAAANGNGNMKRSGSLFGRFGKGKSRPGVAA